MPARTTERKPSIIILASESQTCCLTHFAAKTFLKSSSWICPIPSAPSFVKHFAILGKSYLDIAWS